MTIASTLFLLFMFSTLTMYIIYLIYCSVRKKNSEKDDLVNHYRILVDAFKNRKDGG